MIITDIVFFLVLFVCIFGFIFYSTWSLGSKMNELKSKVLKSHVILRSMSKTITRIESKLAEQEQLIEELKKSAPKKYSGVSQDESLQGYSRAKSLIGRGLSPDKNTLKNCNLTEEEIELLSESFAD